MLVFLELIFLIFLYGGHVVLLHLFPARPISVSPTQPSYTPPFPLSSPNCGPTKSLEVNGCYSKLQTFLHGTLERTRKTCNKLPCCMCASHLAGGVLLKMQNYFEVMRNIFRIYRG